MIKLTTISIFLALLFACSANKKMKAAPEQVVQKGTSQEQVPNDLPECLQAKIKAMAANPTEGAPQSITRYIYKQQTVYYMVAPCCDKFNVVYDSACNIIGRPDGGFTGRGDGKMPDFKKEVSAEKVVWRMTR